MTQRTLVRLPRTAASALTADIAPAAAAIPAPDASGTIHPDTPLRIAVFASLTLAALAGHAFRRPLNPTLRARRQCAQTPKTHS